MAQPEVTVIPARARYGCDGCASAAAYARVLGDPARWVRCLAPGCGAEHAAPVREARPVLTEPPRPRRGPSRPSSDDARRLHQALHELLAWSVAAERVEKRALGAAPGGWLNNVLLSPDGKTLVLGNGCRGTKGVGGAPRPDARDVAVDPVAQGRYDALTGTALACADEVIADGQGDAIVELSFGPEGKTRVVACSLEVRVGLRLAPSKTALKWFAKLATGDSPPALAGARAIGTPALEAFAAAWFDGDIAAPIT